MRSCRRCGCTNDAPCLMEGAGLAALPCSWSPVDPRLCSFCFAGQQLELIFQVRTALGFLHAPAGV